MISKADTLPLILDTHVAIWLFCDTADLSEGCFRNIDRAAQHGDLYLASITLWETSKLVSKGRVKLTIPSDAWLDEALSKQGVQITPLTPRIAHDSCNLPGSFHKDPADQIIVATARQMGAVILTKDQKILDYAAEGYVMAERA